MATGTATVQGHDDSGSNVSRRLFSSSSSSSHVSCTRTKCFRSDVRAWTQRLGRCLYGLNGLWTPGGTSLPHQDIKYAYMELAFFTPLSFAGICCRTLSVSGELSSSNIVRSIVRRAHGAVRPHGLPPWGGSTWLPLSRSTQERVRDDPVISLVRAAAAESLNQ